LSTAGNASSYWGSVASCGFVRRGASGSQKDFEKIRDQEEIELKEIKFFSEEVREKRRRKKES
jgi:hypothetical protein